MKITMSEDDFDQLFRQNARRVAPGIYIDQFGDVHWSVPELLALVDLDDTPENRAAVVQIVTEFAAHNLPALPVVYLEPPAKE